MSNSLRVLVAATILVSATLVGYAREGRAQAPPPPPDVLAALLIEVRGLRAAMEQMASAAPRIQLALGRLQLQEQRVSTLVRRLDEVKANLSRVQKALDEMTQRTTELERMSREAPDADDRRQFEMELKHVQREVARGTLDVQRLQNEEAVLTQDISAEQGRWTEINQRLEELERSLGRR